MHYNCKYKNPFKLHLHKIKFFDKQQNSILSRTHGFHPDSSFRESPADHPIQAAILLIDWVPPCNHKCRLLPTCLVESLRLGIHRVEEPGSIPRFFNQNHLLYIHNIGRKNSSDVLYSWFILGSFFSDIFFQGQILTECMKNKRFQNCLFLKDFFHYVKFWAWVEDNCKHDPIIIRPQYCNANTNLQ